MEVILTQRRPIDNETTGSGWLPVRRYGLLAIWALVALATWHSWQRDPFDPTLRGSDTYGHNQESALVWGLGMSAAELGIVYLALRPWSYVRAWRRPLGALALLLPWSGLLLLSMMHSGKIFMINLMWVLTLDLILFAILVISGGAAYTRWRFERERAA